MQVLIEVPDEKASFVMELLKSLTFVEIKDETDLVSQSEAPLFDQTLSPKTASLLGAFPILSKQEINSARVEAIVRKHY